MAYREPGINRARYMPLDSHDLIALQTNEAYGATVAVNSGTLGAVGNFTNNGGTAAVFGCPGVFGRSIRIFQASRLVTGNGVCQPATAITFSAWVKWNSIITNSNTRLLLKSPGPGWEAPWGIMNLCEMQAGTVYTGGIRTGGVGHEYGVARDGSFLPRFTWTHLAATYDKTDGYVRVYWNGVQVYSEAASGDLSWENNGPWCLGCPPPTSGAESQDCWVCDVRICDVARSSSYLLEQFQRGTFDGLL